MVYDDVAKPAKTGINIAKHGNGVLLTPGINVNQILESGYPRLVAINEGVLNNRFDDTQYYGRRSSSVLINSDFVNGRYEANEIQQLAIQESGSYESTFDIVTSGGTETVLYYDDSAFLTVQIQAAMDATYGPGNTLVNDGGYDSGYWIIFVVFQGALASNDIPQMTITNNATGVSITPSTLTQGASTSTYASQTLTFTPSPTSGEWTLNGETFSYDYLFEEEINGEFAINGSASSGEVIATASATGPITELPYSVGTLSS